MDNHDDRHQIHCCPWNARFEFDPGPQPSQELQTVLALLHCDATISPYRVLYRYTVTYSDIDFDDVHGHVLHHPLQRIVKLRNWI